MADNVAITPGAGDIVAAESISTVKYQKIKLIDATAGSTAGTGIAANPLQVSLANTGANTTTLVVGGNVAAGATDSGNPLKVGGKYNSTLPTLTDGQRGDSQLTSRALFLNSLGDYIYGEDQATNTLHTEERVTFVSISASTAVLSAPGRLMGIFVTAAASTPTMKIWNNTAASGTVIIDTFTPVAGTMYKFPVIEATVGIYVTIGNTVTATIFYKAGL